MNEQYSDYEMNIISDDRNYTIISEDNYTREDGTKDTVITVMGMDEWGNTTKEDIYIVDQNLNLLYSTVFESKKELTEKEFNLLMSYRSGGSGLIKSKCSFTDTEGQEMMLIVTSPKNTENTFRRSRTAFLTNTVTFVILYLLMVVLFSFWISMRVNKPLKMLNSAMNEIGTGKKGTMLHYEGPREFVEICDNFNRMSTALYESEQENLKLQGEKQKMIADISHDLKTPITVIKGYSKAVRDGLAAPEDIGRYLETIYNRSEELTYLIEEFHEYAKMEHPDNAFVFEETDICEYTRTYFAGKYSEFELRGFHLEIDIPEEPVMVSLDEKKFRRIYDNITGNFFRYNVQGSTFFCRVSFDTAEPSEEQYVLITLSDNGEAYTFRNPKYNL